MYCEKGQFYKGTTHYVGAWILLVLNAFAAYKGLKPSSTQLNILMKLC